LSTTDRPAPESGGGRLACIGECMIELVQPDRDDPHRLHRTYGGDTLNTAVYAARLAKAAAEDGADLAVDFVTALGTDPFSDEMVAGWQSEGVGTGLVQRLPGELPGLYMIRTDPDGERSFHYWRSVAAARSMFASPHGDGLIEALSDGVDLYVSGITLAILPPLDRLRLLWLMTTVHASGRLVAFDGNYRPRLWGDAEEARRTLEAATATASVVLTGLEDDCALYGGDPDDPDRFAEAVDRAASLGVPEVVVKGGARGIRLRTGDGDHRVETDAVARPVDTTAAGDSFNAGYLAARLMGRDPLAATACGQAVARRVIMHRGAIVPADATADVRP